MINTILFDLDGTLLRMSQESFIKAYFNEISKVFVRLGMDAEVSIKSIWAGTKAMLLNDGSMLNSDRFWETFAKSMQLNEEQRSTFETAFDNFYSNEFNSVKSVAVPCDIAQRLVPAMRAKGYTVVLATNPLFPACAVESRLNWIGLSTDDFHLVTNYSNSTFCKPNLGYYNEIFSKIGKSPQQCLMVGNNPAEDMCVGELGAETYLVTDCLENEAETDISAFQSGTLAQLEEFLMSFQAIGAS